MNPEVDSYLAEGCGRCALGGTPDCKVHSWTEELKQLRAVVLDTALTEERKWGVPCYTFDGNNVATVSAYKDNATLSFFKGSLLKDPNGVLIQPGANSQAARVIRFTDVESIAEMEPIIKACIAEAIEVEKAGLSVEFKKTSEFDVPVEFQEKLDESPEFKAAFEALTPGRQRGYLLYFAGAKQSKTRTSRVEKYRQKILDGQGFHD